MAQLLGLNKQTNEQRKWIQIPKAYLLGSELLSLYHCEDNTTINLIPGRILVMLLSWMAGSPSWSEYG